MRFNNFFDPGARVEGSVPLIGRQFALALVALALVGCAGEGDVRPQTFQIVKGFLGGVVADEPRAALVGRDVLASGGNAVDAATAVYFALSVTLPSSASLGGGGVCVVRDVLADTVEALEFLPRAPKAGPSGAVRPTAIPGNPRGFFALHSRYGSIRWPQILAEAENLARFGTPVSRALALDVAKVGNALAADGGARRIFTRESKTQPGSVRMLAEGDFITQLELANVLSRLRTLGPGDFYAGQFAQAFVGAVADAGGALGVDDLRGYLPEWRPTLAIETGNNLAHFAPPPAAAGVVAAQVWAMLTRDDDYEDAADGERAHLLAEASLRAFADREGWIDANAAPGPAAASALVSEERIANLWQTVRLDRHVPAGTLRPAPVRRLENPAATTFVTVDRHGSAVACALTMNNLFGTGRIAPGTGILLAMAPDDRGRGPEPLGPMIVISGNNGSFRFASAAWGGAVAPTAMISVALGTLIEKRSLEDAISAKRLHHGGDPDLVYYEPGFDAARLNAMTARGQHVAPTETLGRVNAAYCPNGLPPNWASCSFRADPRGAGLAVGAD